MPFRLPGFIHGLTLLLVLTGGGENAPQQEIPPAAPGVPPQPSIVPITERTGETRRLEIPFTEVTSNRDPAFSSELPRPDELPRPIHADGTTGALQLVLFQPPIPPPPAVPALPVPPPPLDTIPPADLPSPAPDLPPPVPDPVFEGPAYEVGPPIPVPVAPTYQPVAEPLFADILNTSRASTCRNCGPLGWLLGKCGPCNECECGPWGRLFYLGAHEQSCGPGIGRERVMLAPFFVEVTQPFSHYRLRIDDAAGLTFPDRAEFFWAALPEGPIPPEQQIDYQELRLQVELATENVSIATDLPVRLVDPIINDNTGGFSDMTVTQKAVIVDGDYWQITQYFRTYFNTGSARKGLGTGHVSLEPGVLGRYMWTKQTYLHGELLYWFPTGGNPIYSGERLKYGFGISTVLYETDMFAVMPTLEGIGWYFFDGARSLPDGTFTNVDGENFFNIAPGLRLTLGPRGDLGLFEVGIAGALGIGGERLYDSLLRTEFRWSF